MNNAEVPSPPRWAHRFLRWYCSSDYLEEVEGDLFERYQYTVERRGLAKARRQFAWGVARFFNWSTIRGNRKFFSHNNTLSMFRNILTIAWRNLRLQPGYSAINILGLALGLATCVFIMLWVRDERSVDQFHPEQERFYIMMQHQAFGDGNIYTFPSMPGTLKEDLLTNWPEVELASRYGWYEQHLLQNEEKNGFYFGGRRVDAELLQMIGVPLLQGSLDRVLQDGSSIVLTKSTAEAMFEGESAMGKTVTLDQTTSLEVVGVLDDIPENSNFAFDYLISWHVFEAEEEWFSQWGNNSAHLYFRLKDGADASLFNEKIADRVGDFMEDSPTTLFIHPVSDAHLYNRWKNGVQAGGRIENVNVFTWVAFFILAIACINFMNLATARSARRGKEVGLRKVIGALRPQLIFQFLGESFLLTLISGGVAMILVTLLLPQFNEITSKNIELSVLTTGATGLLIGGIIVLTALLAGSYPALYLSKFVPALVLKGQQNRGKAAANFRKGLVILQFTLSILLLVGTTVVFRQLSFMQNANIGYDRENIVMIPLQGDSMEKYEEFRTALLNSPTISHVGASYGDLTNMGQSTWSVDWEGKNSDDGILFTTLRSDFELIETLNMEVLYGRGYNRDLASDSMGYVLNEEAVKVMGYSAKEAVGKPLTLWGDREGTIIGVVRNFNFASLRSNIDPIILVTDGMISNAVVRVMPGQTANAMEVMEAAYAEFAPSFPFEYSFLDEDWENQYRSEQMISKVAGYFAALAIIISLLGLFGLAAFTAEQRTKELGIRKVLGASVMHLLALQSRSFLVLVMVAAAIGSALGYFMMQDWLEKFAYKITLSFSIFLIACGITLLVALITVGFHAVRSAISNPIRALRQQ